MPKDITHYRARPLGFLGIYVRRHWAGHLTVLISVIFAVSFAVFSQYGVKHLIDVVSRGPAQAADDAWTAFAILCALITADNFTWRIGGWAAAYTFVRVTGDMRSDLFMHLAGHAPSYFADRMPGTLASRITATANAVFQTENTAVWNVLPPILGVSLSIALISTVNGMMAIALSAVSAAMALVIFQLAKHGTPIHRDYATKAAGVDGELVDVISNMHVVRAFGATWREHLRIDAAIDIEMTARRRSILYMEKLRLLHAGMTAGITATTLAWGVSMWQQGHATAGDLTLICSLGFTILHGTRDVAVALVDLTQQVARLDEALESLLLPHELPDSPNAVPLISGPGEVTFDAVRFLYPGRPPVIDDLTLTIAPGQRIGLVGASGAGKSTVLSLLQRFYDVNAGAIRIDGQDLRHITQESMRAAMAVVPQDVSLFNRSVMDNIRYARPDASEADVLRAAEIANCRDFIEKLPDGFATTVGNRGTRLSGGQRQRLAIARALLKNAPILLLDEATSALDTESEQLIQAALDKLMQGRTVIAVAHRLSTLRNFDRIIVLDHGRIIEDGPPDALSSRDGPFRQLLRAQTMHEAAEA